MAYTTGKTIAQTAAILVSAGATADAATTALHTLAWGEVNRQHVLWGVLVKCTANHNGQALFSYDATPS